MELQMTNSFFEILQSLFKMQWNIIPVPLPQYSNKSTLEEAVFLCDLNKLAYICFIDKVEGKKKLRQFLTQRRETVINEAGKFINQNIAEDNFESFTLYITNDNKKPWTKLLPKPTENSIGTFFQIEELKYIINTEEADPIMLWKFAKAYTEFVNQCDIKSEAGNLSVFAAYKGNEDCIWPEGKERPDLIIFHPRLSEKYIKQSIEKRKEHLAPISINGKTENISVYNYSEYAPFYTEVGDVNKNAILLENFPRPIWFINDQEKTHHPQFINSQLEMLAFWLMVLSPDIARDFDLHTASPFMVKVILDPRYKPEMRAKDIPPEIPLEKINIPVVTDGPNISITIPVDLINWYAKPDNKGERYVISHFLKEILKSKAGNTEQKIKELIDLRIPVGTAKMSSILGNANNIMLESRYVPAYRAVQQYDLSDIRINLTRHFGIKINSQDLNSTENKKQLCSHIASVLNQQLIQLLKEYDIMLLLPILLNGHEACVQKRAIQRLDLPARTALFGVDPVFIYKEFVKEQDRIKTALSLRCLIELIVAHNMVEGKKNPGIDEVDKLVALMTEMLAWANLSDGIFLGLYDPKMELLQCGRIKVDYESINTTMLRYGFNKTQIELNQFDSGYEDLFSVPNIEDSNSNELKEIEEAFLSELGITFTRLHDFLIDLVNFTRSNNGSTVGIEEPILFQKLKETKFNWSDKEIKAALNAFTLVQGWDIDKPPVGFRKKDTRVWHYNRALSFLRRPIAKLIKDNQTIYFWSYRHLYAAFDNIYMHLVNGTLWSSENGAINKLVAKYADKKGDHFRAEVHSWLKENSDLEILKEEIPIKPKTKLDAETDLGDIDIFAIDKEKQVIYSIECKNTSESKSIHDFKTDIDQYLNPKGKKYIQKHQNRDEWLKQNLIKLNAYVNDAETFKITSVIVTAFEIPIAYTHTSPLPLLSFPKLKLEGIQALKNFA
ncbi:MAG TPA: hypothetical protein VGF30_01315 [Bacteroidia bacterium]